MSASAVRARICSSSVVTIRGIIFGYRPMVICDSWRDCGDRKRCDASVTKANLHFSPVAPDVIDAHKTLQNSNVGCLDRPCWGKEWPMTAAWFYPQVWGPDEKDYHQLVDWKASTESVASLLSALPQKVWEWERMTKTQLCRRRPTCIKGKPRPLGYVLYLQVRN